MVNFQNKVCRVCRVYITLLYKFQKKEKIYKKYIVSRHTR